MMKRKARGEPQPRLAFAGEVDEGGLYFLGVRVYSAGLRRFLNPDAASPFDEGGLNRYAYCAGDPVNRIDPSGHAWLDYLAAGLGLFGAIVGSVMSAGALVGAIGASMPSIVSLAATAAMDVVSVVAEATSLAGLLTGDSNLTQVGGWFAFATGLMSGGASLVEMRRAGAAVRGRKASMARRNDGNAAEVAMLPAAAHQREARAAWEYEGRVATMPSGYLTNDSFVPVPEFHRFADDIRYPGVVHYAADTRVNRRQVMDVVTQLTREGGPDVVVYWHTGAHGKMLGQNWSVEGRLFGDPMMLANDHYKYESLANAVNGKKVYVSDLDELTPTEALEDWALPGIHIHAYCYGAVDELLLQMFNRSPVPVYFL